MSEQPSSPPFEVDPRTVNRLAESLLVEWNVPYEYVADFPLANLKNAEWVQVREAAHIADRDSQAEYRMQMAQGAVFPPIVVMAPDVLADGNHRVSSAKALRRKTFPALVARFNSVDLAKAFTAAVNQSNGRRLTPSEAYEAALAMMLRGMDDSAIARSIGRSPDQVRIMRKQREMETRAAGLVEVKDLVDKVPASQRAKLAQIKNNPAFVEAVKFVASAKPTAKDVTQIVDAIGRARTDTEEVEAVRKFVEELAPSGPPPVRVTILPALRQARAHLGGLVKLSARPQDLLDLTDAEKRKGSVEHWRIVRELADKVLAAYGED